LINQDIKKLYSDTLSIFSSRQHATSIYSLPDELLTMIIGYTNDHESQVRCLYVNKLFHRAAKPIVYENLQLKSTYRCAQLVSSLKEFPNGEYIKSLDLSQLHPGLIEKEDKEEEEEAFASWRDWKYKDDPLYGFQYTHRLNRSKSTMSYDSDVSMGSFNRLLTKIKSSDLEISKLKQSLRKVFRWGSQMKSSITNHQSTTDEKVVFQYQYEPFLHKHPMTNRFLMKYSHSKDLPIGYVIYFITLCPNLHSLNLSNISLSDDFQITNTSNSLVDYEISDAMFLSDSNVHFNDHLQVLKLTEVDILVKISQLTHLKVLNMSNIPWLNYKLIYQFIMNSESIQTLINIDLTNSGMIRSLRWAKQWDIDDFKEYFKDKIEPTIEEVDEFDALVRGIGLNY
jgi:hypothetical protein